jgi:hypothetical protein
MAYDSLGFMRSLYFHGVRVLRISAGIILLIAGIIMAIPFVPGPGLLVIVIALSLLAVDFAWARHARDKVHTHGKRIVSKVARRQPDASQNRTSAPDPPTADGPR